MKVAEAVGRALTASGIDHVFGVVGSGNFHLTNAMVAAGARFVAARHEGGAATMADAYARTSGSVAALSVHQGPGLTNALTGITEAAKSRTPLLVLAAEATAQRSNFRIEQAVLGHSVGALTARLTTAHDAVEQARAALRRARYERRTVLLNLPLEVQALDVPAGVAPAAVPLSAPESAPEQAEPSQSAVADLVRALERSRRPVFVAAAAPAPLQPVTPWPHSPTGTAHCSRPRPSPGACSRAAPGRSTSPAASPRPWRPN